MFVGDSYGIGFTHFQSTPPSGKNLSSRGGGEKINLPTTVTVDGP